ncbi:restriction endonuclease subunit S [Citrobacter portucalensis]|nr:restriction endonuclease subunit S [Citrobacter portucalensis]MEB1053335.1 restriction endonuclease subunit S [Citrobacter portucalensis]
MKYFSSHPSWSKSSLEDIAIHIIGGDWGKDPEFSEEGYESVSCIRGSEFRNWKKNFGNTAVMRKVKASSLISRELIKNDILVEISGGGPDQPVGRTVLIDDRVLNNQVLPLVCTNFLRLVRLSSEVSASFINRYLEFFYSSGEVTKYQGGSNNLRNLKFKDYSKIEIPLPPLTEQKIIAEKLDTLLAQVDSTKARLEQIPQILKRFRQAVLISAIEGKLTTSKTISLGKLGDIAEIISGVAFKKSQYSINGCRLLQITNVSYGETSWENPSFIPFSLAEEYENYSLIENDIVLALNRPITNGRLKVTAIKKFDLPAILYQRVARIRTKCNKIISTNFLLVVMHSPFFLKQVEQNLKGSDQPYLNTSSLYDFKIFAPSITEQHEIVRRVEQLFAYADTIEKQVNNALTRVNSLTQSILAKAFRGELTAQWRAENPDLISGENSAAALLEKIKAERAASGGKKTSRKKS